MVMLGEVVRPLRGIARIGAEATGDTNSKGMDSFYRTLVSSPENIEKEEAGSLPSPSGF